MKLIVLFLLIPFVGASQTLGTAQPFTRTADMILTYPMINGPTINCGTWKEKDPVFSEWQAVDTLEIKKSYPSKRQWVYDVEHEQKNNVWTTFIYTPCGSPRTRVYYQYRVCAITGIREIRYRTIEWEYTPPPTPPKTEYEKVIEKFEAKRSKKVNGSYIIEWPYDTSSTKRNPWAEYHLETITDTAWQRKFYMK